MAKRMKMPNGQGSVWKMSGKRRKPYGVSITIGYDEYGKQKRIFLGSVLDPIEGYEMISNYLNKPFNQDEKNITYEDIFNRLEPKWKEEVYLEKMSLSNYQNLVLAYRNQLTGIHKKRITDTKKRELQFIIDNSSVGYTSRGYMKNVLNRFYKYAIDYLELPIENLAMNLNQGEKEKSTLHKILTPEEINMLLNDEDKNYFTGLIILSLYTGLRPEELITIENVNVHIEEQYMIGGCKTDAGRDRIIPIHNDILNIVKKLYNPLKKYLVNNPNTNEKLRYEAYLTHFKLEMKRLGLDHVPYDTRHTFATTLSSVGVSDSNIKRLMGHSLGGDVTNDVYIHKTTEDLLKEVNKINYRQY